MRCFIPFRPFGVLHSDPSWAPSSMNRLSFCPEIARAQAPPRPAPTRRKAADAPAKRRGAPAGNSDGTPRSRQCRPSRHMGRFQRNTNSDFGVRAMSPLWTSHHASLSVIHICVYMYMYIYTVYCYNRNNILLYRVL